MKSILIISLILTIISCENNNNNIVERTHGNKIKRDIKKMETLKLIRDNLYVDKNQNLFLKSKDVSGSNGKDKYIYDVWIDEFDCDSCGKNNKLKSIIDIKTFKLKTFKHKEMGDYYEDCNHTYFHRWMSDGGVMYIVK